MLHHYVQRGERLEYLLNLPFTDKLFYKASAELYREEEKAKWEATYLSLQRR